MKRVCFIDGLSESVPPFKGPAVPGRKSERLKVNMINQKQQGVNNDFVVRANTTKYWCDVYFQLLQSLVSVQPLTPLLYWECLCIFI